jgi:hypothetical protein
MLGQEGDEGAYRIIGRKLSPFGRRDRRLCRRSYPDQPTSVHPKIQLSGRTSPALEWIQLPLGYAGSTATARDLGGEQDLTDAPCERLGVRVAAGPPAGRVRGAAT